MNILETFFELGKSKLTNRVLSTFIGSWLIWNWEIVVIFFDDQVGYELMILQIKERGNIFVGLVFPGLSTIGLLWVIPILDWGSDFQPNKWEIKRLENRKKLVGKKLELEKLELDWETVEDLKKSYDKTIHIKNLEIQKLKDELGSVKGRVRELDIITEKLNEKIENHEKLIDEKDLLLKEYFKKHGPLNDQ